MIFKLKHLYKLDVISSGAHRPAVPAEAGGSAQKPGFSSLLTVFSLTGLPMMGFLAASSYIYEVRFGLSAQAYSYFFSPSTPPA